MLHTWQHVQGLGTEDVQLEVVKHASSLQELFRYYVPYTIMETTDYSSEHPNQFHWLE